VPEPAGDRGGAADVEPPTTRGPGRVLVAIYGLFTLAAGARAGVQLAVQYSEAPVAYVLSAVAALIYLSATIGLARGGRSGRRLATVACSIELAGVLAVGTLSLTDRAAFPDATVWSGYGRGYGFVPLALPVLGLLWLRHKALEAAEEQEVEAGDDAGAAPATVQKSPPPPPPSQPPPSQPPPSSTPPGS
jgi:hypothetical protein